MSLSSSRRSFLLGRRETVEDRWARLLVGLKRNCLGTVALLSPTQARLVPGGLDDVLRALELCRAHGGRLALDGLQTEFEPLNDFTVLVEPGSAWGTLIPLGESGLWRVDAGCPLVAMKAAALVGPEEPADGRAMAHWLASWDGVDPDASGLVTVEWLFADGTVEVLGPFGVADSQSQPLRSTTAQTIIPKLFELASQLPSAVDGQPGRYRLEALRTDAVNLAHLLLGHGGTLGWAIAATFRAPRLVCAAGSQASQGFSRPNRPPGGFDSTIKQIMDPHGYFPCLPRQTG